MSDYKALLQQNALPQGFDYNALVHFARTMLPPATALYMTVDDRLQARIFAPNGPNVVNLSWRLQTPDGQVIPGFRTVTATTAGTTPLVVVLEQVEGYVLSVTVETPGTPRGQVFVQVEVIRGVGTGDSTSGHVLAAGYPGSGTKIGFPQSPIASPSNGPGWTSVITVSVPSAGADWTQTVPPGEQWIVRAVRAVLTTSATVGNRIPILTLTDAAAHILTQSYNSIADVASNNANFMWANGYQQQNLGNLFTQPWPYELRMQAGWILSTSTLGIVAGDQWSAIQLTVERFITS
jgi:hypothetical protein